MTATSTAPTLPVDSNRAHPLLPQWAKTQAPSILGFVLLSGIAAASIWFMVDNNRFNDASEQTLRVRGTAFRLLSLAQDAETGQRGYLLSGNKDYLAPYDHGRTEVPRALDDLRALIAGRYGNVMSSLQAALDAKLRELAVTVDLKTKGDDAAALRTVATGLGNNLMGQIRADLEQIDTGEQRALSDVKIASRTNDRFLVAASLVGVVLVLALGAYTIWSSGRAAAALMRARDELQHSNDNLEGMVAERVAELQMANDEIQRFAYIVSHDLRAPLVNVMGFTSELETASADIASFLEDVEGRAPDLVTPDRRLAGQTDLPEALGFIRTSTAKMDRLINAILKLSREGRRVLTPQTIDLHALIEAQGESLSQQLSTSQSEFIIQPDLPDLVSDRLAVEQIFGNLIENATKYLAPGRPGRIEVKGERTGLYVRYEIADNGRGIDIKDFERIFELFRRSGEQDKPGEGIGLAYVRNLARRLGGNVTVDSTFGEGSTFTVTLPAVFNPNRKSRS